MGNVKEQFCKFCFTNISENKVKDVENVIKDMSDAVLLKLNCYDKDEHVMCTVCWEKLSAAFTFKSMCLNSDSTINSYMEEEYIQLDIKDVYAKENRNKYTVDMLDNQNVCRLCVQLVSEYTLINKVASEMIQKLIPEMNLQFTRDPVICKMCFDSLTAHIYFLENYLGVEERVKNVCAGEVTDSALDVVLSEPCIKTELNWEESEPTEMFIKNESIEIKPDVIEQESASVSLESEEEVLAAVIEKCNLPEEERQTAACCNVKGCLRGKNHLVLRMYKCDKCDFQTAYENCIKLHQLEHKHSSVVQMHQRKCSYKTIRKDFLKTNLLTHRDMYKCNDCKYESKSKKCFKQHQLKHTGRTYKCTKCDFEFKSQYLLSKHKITHWSDSKKLRLKCDKCDFQGLCKSHLIRHEIIHKDVSEVTMYSCSVCNFETRHKHHIKNHELIHKDVTDVQMFACSECSFNAKRKSSLVNHMLLHKVPTELHHCDKEVVNKKKLTLRARFIHFERKTKI